jgi:hypothetical protein
MIITLLKTMVITFLLAFVLASYQNRVNDMYPSSKIVKDAPKKTQSALVSFTFKDPARGKDTTFNFNTVDSAVIHTTSDGRIVYGIYLNVVFADQFKSTPHEHSFQISIVDTGALSPGDYLVSYTGNVKTCGFWQYFPYDGGGYAASTPYKTTVVNYNPSKLELNATFGGEWVSNGTINGVTFIAR